jgi:hypothetical protein
MKIVTIDYHFLAVAKEQQQLINPKLPFILINRTDYRLGVGYTTCYDLYGMRIEVEDGESIDFLAVVVLEWMSPYIFIDYRKKRIVV